MVSKEEREENERSEKGELNGYTWVKVMMACVHYGLPDGAIDQIEPIVRRCVRHHIRAEELKKSKGRKNTRKKNLATGESNVIPFPGGWQEGGRP